MKRKSAYAAALLCLFCSAFTAVPLPAEEDAIISVPYHGMRMIQNSSFYVRRISVEKNDTGEYVISVFFSAAIDPRSVEVPHLLINNAAPPPETSVLFNKAGTEMAVILPPEFAAGADSVTLTVSLNDAVSFDGTELAQTEFDNLVCGDVYVFDDMPDDGAK